MEIQTRKKDFLTSLLPPKTETMKQRAEKKVQVAIDKMIDLQQDLCDDDGRIERVLEALRCLESDISYGKVKNGRIKF